MGEILEVDTVDPELKFADYEMWDSLAKLSLIMGLEELNFQITGNELDKIDSIGLLFQLANRDTA